MKRFSTHFFLLLSAFVLTVYGQWHSRSQEDHLHSFPVKLSETATWLNTDIGKSNVTWIYASPTSHKHDVIQVAEVREAREEVEEDDDEQDHRVSSKKTGGNHYLLATLSQTFNSPLDFGKEILSFGQQFSNTSSCKRYLVFQSFRI